MNIERKVYIMSLKSKSIISLIVAFMICLSSCAMACTAIYVGGDLTQDGATLFARSEDLTNSYNKLMYVSKAGEYKKGELYQGCYGYFYTFSKDSYSFTTMTDDNWEAVDNVCPDCGGNHKHNPYGAAGTNEMGLTVTATETLYTSSPAYDVDPFVDSGIEEAEITTILLSECATAKEAVDLLTKIYDESGCNNGSGIFLADHTEVWYIENVTGHQYIAVKLNGSVAFVQPNQSVIALVDLDDTENVVASKDLIAVAKEAGTYVGDEEANTINYVLSYNAEQTPSSRMLDGLDYVYGKEMGEDVTFDDYTISNVDASGAIVPFYSNIVLDHTYSVADIIGYYKIPGIGKTGNLETHIFQIYSEDSLTDTVEWVAMDDGEFNAFVPYYPMLTTDTYKALKVSTAEASFATEQPESGVYYAATATQRTAEGRVKVEGFKVLPENWADSYYWTFDALSNLLTYGDYSVAEIAKVNCKMNALQNHCYAAFNEMHEAVANAESKEAAQQIATQISMQTAEKVHTEVVALVNGLIQ
ncbi:MAG: C69 family dipeptidase [Clostridia bacterium]|nr:C69 family dipeptidase [Clostridia bacterium]